MSRQLSELVAGSGVGAASELAEQTVTLASLGVLRTDGADRARRTVQAAMVLEEDAYIARGQMRTDSYAAAFACWNDVLDIVTTEPAAAAALPADSGQEPMLWLALHLAATGIASERITETRHALDAFPTADAYEAADDAQSWEQRLIRDIAAAVLLLTRKAHGWADIDVALRLLTRLREQQDTFEPGFLDDSNDPQTAAVRLISIYHQAQMVTTAGRYIESGDGASAGVLARLATHLRQAEEAAGIIGDGNLARSARLVHTAVAPSVERSIWAQVELLGENARSLARSLTGRDRPHPTLELWPSQVAAMNDGMFDTNRRALVVQMPTSGGKTLLAKFSIMQALALNPTASIAYVVPTKVLVSQVTDELRRDLSPLNRRVEQAMPVFDLDPTEDVLLLRQRPDVLVTTPEKLDLLVRANHSAVADLSLVIVDEAHNIADPSRGARLELLLATIKRDKPNARYLLLSPFMPNSDELVAWLGSGRPGGSIRVDWQPNKKVVGEFAVELRAHPNGGRKRQRHVVFRTVDSVDNGGLPVGSTVDLAVTDIDSPSSADVTRLAEEQLLRRGQTLIVCAGRTTSMIRANQLAEARPERTLTVFAQSVLRHVESELGPDNGLAYAIRRGVAYHHAGVSAETRRLVEALMSDGFLDVVCGTTTLAQGANFPLANVIVEAYWFGDRALSHSDFWNIAGRAGRGMLSGTGLVGYSSVTPQQRAWWEQFFTGEAGLVASQLSEVIEKADLIGAEFRLSTIRNVQHLSEFMQYLAHAYRVSGAMQSANEVEDLLRSSLVFSSAERAAPADAERLVVVCRRYLESIRNDAPLVALADGTGFSTSTVRFLQRQMFETPSVRDVRTWSPDVLFGADNGPLTDRVRMIADLPEIHLGENRTGEFNPERIANILRDWVNGSTIANMVDVYGDPEKTGEARTAQFVSYLQGNLANLASWGMGALEKVALAGSTPEDRGDAGHVPSMILYGVNDREAVWLRMAGLGRVTAQSGAQLWREQGRRIPETFDEVRDWVRAVPTTDWDRVLTGTPLTGDDVRRIWDRTGA